jgi:hypothetical protein
MYDREDDEDDDEDEGLLEDVLDDDVLDEELLLTPRRQFPLRPRLWLEELLDDPLLWCLPEWPEELHDISWRRCLPEWPLEDEEELEELDDELEDSESDDEDDEEELEELCECAWWRPLLLDECLEQLDDEEPELLEQLSKADCEWLEWDALDEKELPECPLW